MSENESKLSKKHEYDSNSGGMLINGRNERELDDIFVNVTKGLDQNRKEEILTKLREASRAYFEYRGRIQQ